MNFSLAMSSFSVSLYVKLERVLPPAQNTTRQNKDIQPHDKNDPDFDAQYYFGNDDRSKTPIQYTPSKSEGIVTYHMTIFAKGSLDENKVVLNGYEWDVTFDLEAIQGQKNKAFSPNKHSSTTVESIIVNWEAIRYNPTLHGVTQFLKKEKKPAFLDITMTWPMYVGDPPDKIELNLKGSPALWTLKQINPPSTTYPYHLQTYPIIVATWDPHHKVRNHHLEVTKNGEEYTITWTEVERLLTF